MTCRSEDIKTPLCRLAFGQGLFELKDTGRINKKTGKPILQYQATLLFKKGDDLSALHAAALSAAKEEWGDKAEAWIRDEIIKSPFLDGDGKQGRSKKTGETHKGFAGCTFVRVMANEEHPPKLFDKKVRPTADKSVVYSGVHGYAVVNAYTWENDENGKGISFSISAFQAAKDDDKLGGEGVNPDKFFEAIPDEGAAPDSTKTGEGAKGLFG